MSDPVFSGKGLGIHFCVLVAASLGLANRIEWH